MFTILEESSLEQSVERMKEEVRKKDAAAAEALRIKQEMDTLNVFVRSAMEEQKEQRWDYFRNTLIIIREKLIKNPSFINLHLNTLIEWGLIEDKREFYNSMISEIDNKIQHAERMRSERKNDQVVLVVQEIEEKLKLHPLLNSYEFLRCDYLRLHDLQNDVKKWKKEKAQALVSDEYDSRGSDGEVC